MNLDRALERAQGARGPQEGAKLYADIDYELAMGEPSQDQYDQGEQALSVLEQRFPGVRQRSHDVVETGHLPNLSRTASQRVHTPDSTPAAGRPRTSSSGRRVNHSSGSGGRSSSRGRRSSGPGVGDLLGAGGGSATGAALLGLRLILLLGLGYFLLTRRGSSAFAGALGTVTAGVGRLMDPGRDLIPVGSKGAGSSSSSSGPPAKPMSTSPGPASSATGVSTPTRPSMLGDPFGLFPATPTPFPAPRAPVGVRAPAPRRPGHSAWPGWLPGELEGFGYATHLAPNAFGGFR